MALSAPMIAQEVISDPHPLALSHRISGFNGDAKKGKTLKLITIMHSCTKFESYPLNGDVRRDRMDQLKSALEIRYNSGTRRHKTKLRELMCLS